MRTTKHHFDHRSDPLRIGPQLGFAAATLSAFAALSGLIVTIPNDLVMPVVASLFLGFALAFALLAWQRGGDPTRVTYTDVAGALTLIGLFAASTIEPDQLVRLIQQDGEP